MRHLKDISSTVISLSDMVDCIRENRPFPPKSVAITFDDGLKNFYDIAYPILKENGFAATVFLVPEYCGKNNQWDGQPEGIPELDLLDWHEIMEMADNGIDLGAHTMSHPNLLNIPFEQAVQEIVDSKSVIERKLGNEVMFFAYPYGKLDRRVRRIVKNEFFGACSTELGFVNLNSDIYSLPRIDMYYFSQNSLFKMNRTIFFRLYIAIRSALRSFRIRTSSVYG